MCLHKGELGKISEATSLCVVEKEERQHVGATVDQRSSLLGENSMQNNVTLLFEPQHRTQKDDRVSSTSTDCDCCLSEGTVLIGIMTIDIQDS